MAACVGALALLASARHGGAQSDPGSHAKLVGSITDAGNGHPLPGALVVVEGTQLRALTSSTGRYEVPGIDPGLYVVRIAAIGYRAVTRRDVAIAPGESHQLDVALARAPVQLSQMSVTASRTEEQSGQSTASVAVLTGEQLVDLGAIRVDAALRYIPGVTLNNDQNNDVSIRGSSGVAEGIGSRVLMLVDGHPLLSADGGEIDFNALPLLDVDRVEVVKGAYSAAYGSNALGGVINLITTPISDRPQTIVEADYGTYDVPAQYRFTGQGLNYSGVDLVQSQQIADVGTRIGLDRQTSTGFRQDGFSGRWVARGKFTYPNDAAHPSSFYAIYTDELGGDFTGATNDADPYVVDSAARRDQSRYRRLDAGGTIIPWATRSAELSLTPSVDYDDSQNDYYSIDNHDYHHATRYGTGAQLTLDPSLDHAVVVGGEAAHTDVVSNILGTPILEDEAIFAQDDWDITDRWRGSLGARLDAHRSSGSPAEDAVSPKLGVRYLVDDETTVRASIGRGYRAPSAIEQFTSTFQQGVCVVPNPELRGETAWSGEVGATSALTSRASIDGALFESDYNGLISPVLAPSSASTCPQSALSAQFQNVDRARVRGIDVSTRVALIREWLNLQLAYTYLDSRNLDNPAQSVEAGKQLPYRSNDNFTGSLDFLGGLAGVDLRYRSRPAVVLEDPVEPRSNITVVDARLGYHIWHTILQLKAANLLQARYVDVLEHYYGAPRSLQMTARQYF
jgi:outer membrane receptor protein involved in Fe transport